MSARLVAYLACADKGVCHIDELDGSFSAVELCYGVVESPQGVRGAVESDDAHEWG